MCFGMNQAVSRGPCLWVGIWAQRALNFSVQLGNWLHRPPPPAAAHLLGLRSSVGVRNLCPPLQSSGGSVAPPGDPEPPSCRWILPQGLEACRLGG